MTFKIFKYIINCGLIIKNYYNNMMTKNKLGQYKILKLHVTYIFQYGE